MTRENKEDEKAESDHLNFMYYTQLKTRKIATNSISFNAIVRDSKPTYESTKKNEILMLITRRSESCSVISASFTFCATTWGKQRRYKSDSEANEQLACLEKSNDVESNNLRELSRLTMVSALSEKIKNRSERRKAR